MKAKKLISKMAGPLVKSTNLFPVVGIGASAGGLDAFKKLLKAIPVDSGMAYVLVQHLAPSHESMLPEILQKVTSIPVLEITNDIKVEPNHIYVIPSNKMMLATDGVLLLAPRPEKSKSERNLPIDLFFTSLAEVHQAEAIGVVLSGTATDGTLGLKAIKDHGGITFAQDEASAAYQGMPHSAAQAGVVDFIMPPEKIPQKLLEVTNILYSNGGDELNLPQQDEDIFKQILSLLRIRKGTDFTYYKQTTIRRRIFRRMAINKSEVPGSYLKYLRENKAEQDFLYQDLLIPVTNFFRDPKTFDNLCESVFPLILKNKIPGETIRIWIAGCSTGEEAYSVAICFKEFLGERLEKVQIFATDISEPAIIKARSGIYTKNDVDGLTPQRLQEFFTKSNGSYQVNKTIRDMCVFAVHNFLKDPPFGKMDFISCRNVLIYMEPYLQKKAMTTFHYSLNPKGFLLLGKSETTAGVPELFTSASKSDKLFNRKDVPSKYMHIATQRSEQGFAAINVHPKIENIRTDFQKTADDIMLSRYTPAGVVVNEAMDIVHFRGITSNYLEQSPGKPSHNLLKMAKEGLAFELRNILHKVKRDVLDSRQALQPSIKENIPLQINGILHHIAIEALLLPDTIEPHYLVLFHDKINSNEQLAVGSKKTSISKAKNDAKDLRIQQLEKELAQSREDMRTITEEQEAANEELQSANEELLSGSEELQSLNEEMETSKEELQSTNEELMVVNHEMISLNEQVTAARDYSKAIVSNIREPLLVLDKNLTVKTANKAFYKTFRVNEVETEGVLIYDLGNKQWNISKLRLLLEKILPEKSVFNDFEVTHTFSAIGQRVMLLNAREVINKNSSEKLILLSFEDITDLKKAQEVLRKSSEHFRQLVKELPAAVYSCDADGFVNFYNDAAVKIWGREPEIGKERWCGSFKMFNPDGTILPPENSPMAKAINEGCAIMGQEIIIGRPDGSQSVVLVFPQPEFGLSGEITGAINMGFDVTEIKRAELILRHSEEQFRQMAELMPQKVWTSDAEGNKNYFNQTLLDYVGFSLEELKGQGWEKIIHPVDWEKNKKQWMDSILTGNNYEAENRLLRKDGKYLWHLTQAVALRDDNGKVKIWIGSKTEIQDQREQKEELEKAKNNAELKSQIAEDAMKSKQQFLSNMSHEIRTPMNAIVGFTNVVLKTALNKEQKEYINAIKVSGDALIVLINDILDLAKVDAGKMTFEQTQFNLSASISTTLQVFETKIQEKNLVLHKQYDAAIPEVLVGDPMRLRQILLNLVSNAVKFTIEGKVTLAVSLLNEDAENVRIEFAITDTGIGIAENRLDKIFDDFEQAAYENSRLYGGTGLGLSIVKKLVELQGGSIRVESQIGKGSTFYFVLSFGKPKANESAPNTLMNEANVHHSTQQGSLTESIIHKVKVLVVEDLALNQLLMKIILLDFGFEMDIADNGRIAIEKLQKDHFDIILMDLQMPEMNGFETTAFIRSQMKSQIPIIALTADVTTTDVEKCKAFGMNDYISKPIDEKLLFNKIKKYVSKPSQH
jgi:two-component system CheB/CheR fusion protein